MSKEKKSGILSRMGGAIKGIGTWYIGLYKGRPWWMKTLATIGTLIVAFFLYLGAVDNNVLWLFGKSPSMHTISGVWAKACQALVCST